MRAGLLGGGCADCGDYSRLSVRDWGVLCGWVCWVRVVRAAVITAARLCGRVCWVRVMRAAVITAAYLCGMFRWLETAGCQA